MTQDQDYGAARALLDGPIDAVRWEGLCAWVEGGPAQRLEERVEYVRAQIDRRPWVERRACSALRVWQREIDMGELQPKHRILRHARLRDSVDVGRKLRSPHLSGLEALSLSSPGKRAVMALVKASCAPRLKSLELFDAVKASLHDRLLGEEGMLPALEHLVLGTYVQPDMSEALNAPLFSRVRHLDVEFGRQTHALLADLESPALRELTMKATHAGRFLCTKSYDQWPDITDVLALPQVLRLERIRLVNKGPIGLQLYMLFDVLQRLPLPKSKAVLDLAGLRSEASDVTVVVEGYKEQLTTGPLATRFGEVLV